MVLIVTADHRLRDALLRLAAAADVAAEVARTADAAYAAWHSARLVLVGVDSAGALAALQPAHRPGVVLVAGDSSADPYRLAVELGAQDVATLPGRESWLVSLLAAGLEPSRGRCLTIALVGGRGGVGTSVLAATFALVAARRGLRTLLVDGDPLGGGLDLVLGVEQTPGARWPAFTGVRGRLNPTALHDSLPGLSRSGLPHDLCVLSWTGHPTPAPPPTRPNTPAAPAPAARARSTLAPTPSAVTAGPRALSAPWGLSARPATPSALSDRALDPQPCTLQPAPGPLGHWDSGSDDPSIRSRTGPSAPGSLVQWDLQCEDPSFDRSRTGPEVTGAPPRAKPRSAVQWDLPVAEPAQVTSSPGSAHQRDAPTGDVPHGRPFPVPVAGGSSDVEVLSGRTSTTSDLGDRTPSKTTVIPHTRDEGSANRPTSTGLAPDHRPATHVPPPWSHRTATPPVHYSTADLAGVVQDSSTDLADGEEPCDRLDVATAGSVLEAAAKAFEVIVVDLPRSLGPIGAVALPSADAAFLIVPAEVRATVAAGQVAAEMARHTSTTRLIVRRPAPGGLTPQDIATAISIPLAGELAPDRRIPRALENGSLPAAIRRTPTAALCDRLLHDLASPRRTT